MMFSNFASRISISRRRKLSVWTGIDRKILAELQSGRSAHSHRAGRSGWTIDVTLPPPASRPGAVRGHPGYHAQLDPLAVGLTFEALVFVTMRGADRDTITGFEHAVTEIPNILHAQRLFGEPDYLLRVIAADLPAFHTSTTPSSSTLPGVQKLTSTLVMKNIVENRACPCSWPMPTSLI